MKNLNKIATAFCAAVLGILMLSSCEGGDLYNVASPDWLASRIDSIAAEKAKQQGGDQEIEGLQEDVYQVGAADFSTGWWAAFSKYYPIPAGEKWVAQFNLNINPAATKTYKNFAMIICNDEDRGAANYKEYGAIRFDNQPSGNSEWGDYINRDLVESTLTFGSDTDAGVDKLGGKVTLTVDRTTGGLLVTMTNGTVTKTYKQTTPLENLNADPSNETIRCFLVPEGSCINFLGSTLEPIGGFTEAGDKIPVSMVLNNVPDEVLVGTTLEEAMKDVTADVTFESLPTPQTIKAENLHFNAIPDMDNPGEKTLVVIFNKTFKGENAEKPIIANATFKVVKPIESIEVTKAPSNMKYYFYYNPDITGGLERTLPFDPTGMEVTATYVDGSKEVMNNSKLTFDSVPAEEGTYNVKITTANGKTTTVKGISVVESEVTEAKMTPSIVGNEDNSTGWWGAHADNKQVPVGATYKVNFTNYSPSTGNWNNFVIILRGMSNQPEYAVVRADNYGWASGYDGNAELVHGCNLPFDEKWLTSMNGAKCTAYITNSGNNRADIQVVAKGADDFIYTLYYLNIKTNQDDLGLSFTVDGSHIVFE